MGGSNLALGFGRNLATLADHQPCALTQAWDFARRCWKSTAPSTGGCLATLRAN